MGNRLNKNNVVTIANALNALKYNDMTLDSMRIFACYVSRVNPKDKATKTVEFTKAEYAELIGKKRIHNCELQESLDNLKKLTFRKTYENGDFESISIFETVKYIQETKTIKLTVHPDIIPCLFDLHRGNYFSYKLRNVLNLRSVNQFRMYEILRQYKYKGEFETDLETLSELIGIDPDNYTRFDNFRNSVLDKCQAALKKYTDICFTYHRGKVGNGGKWQTIIFRIYDNKPESSTAASDDQSDAAAATTMGGGQLLRNSQTVFEDPAHRQQETNTAQPADAVTVGTSAAETASSGAAPALEHKTAEHSLTIFNPCGPSKRQQETSTASDDQSDAAAEQPEIIQQMKDIAIDLTVNEVIQLHDNMVKRGFKDILQSFCKMYYKAIGHTPYNLYNYIAAMIDREKVYNYETTKQVIADPEIEKYKVLINRF